MAKGRNKGYDPGTKKKKPSSTQGGEKLISNDNQTSVSPLEEWQNSIHPDEIIQTKKQD